MKKGFNYVKEKIKQVPALPGCYLMLDSNNEIFYIGKAKNLKARIKSYFLHTDKRLFVQLLEAILFDLEIIVVKNELESLILERDLINKHKPRFNIMLKDDKNYLLLKLKKPILSSDKKNLKFPKLEIVRKTKKDNAKYFGPFPSASKLRSTLDIINKYFSLRSCPDNVINNRIRPCIQHQIGRCYAPCVYDITNYEQELDNVSLFLNGNSSEINKRLTIKMLNFAQAEQFEQAAKIRDQIEAIKTSLTTQVIKQVNNQKNQDIIGFARIAQEVTITQIQITHGSWQQSKSFHFSNQLFSDEEILNNFLHQLYFNHEISIIPHEIIIPFNIKKELAALNIFLNNKSNKKTTIIYPIKAKKAALLDIANQNALQALKEHLNYNQKNQENLESLQNILSLKNIPRRIECIDISLIQGTNPVGSLVVFIDGIMDKKLYRSFTIKNIEGNNDFLMINQVVSRRLKQGVLENNLPDLLLIDGGKGQLSAALDAAQEQNIIISPETFYIAAIAKARTSKNTEERLFVPNNSEAIILQKHTKERYLVERIRDEAHRFALTKHRQKRRKQDLSSRLLSIKGLGKVRALALLKHFGSINNIKNAQNTEIAKLLKISEEKVLEILRNLN